MQKKVFPFHLIKKNSDVLIYGAGKRGKSYYEQIQMVKWCNIVGVVDRNYENVVGFSCPVIGPNKIKDMSFDYLCVAIGKESVAREIIYQLVSEGVEAQKIVWERTACFFAETRMCVDIDEGEKSDLLEMALNLHGGIGDHIMYVNVYDRLKELGGDIIIDLYTDNKVEVVESIFFGRNGLRGIYRGTELLSREKEYDVVIDVFFQVRIDRYDQSRLEQKAPKLLATLNQIFDYQKIDLIENPEMTYENRVVLDRAKLLNKNRISYLDITGALKINGQFALLRIDDKYEERFKQLGLPKRYITYNHGAADAIGNGKPPIKVWPLKYHEILNKMIKERFPDIELIQIGSKSCTLIPGADRYIMGEPLDVTKMILNNAICHLDCEGGLAHMCGHLELAKAIVLFGPSDYDFLKYDTNINVAPEECGGCMEMTRDWYTRCIRYEKPRCMYSITPIKVFNIICKQISKGD